MTTRCHKCGRELENTGEKYLSCEDCHQFTPNIDYSNQKLKGGEKVLESHENEGNKNSNMATKKTTKKKKMATEKKPETEQPVAVEKKVKEKKKSITDARVENANRVLEYMDKELKIDDTEKRKVFSRAYGIVSQKMKKK